jgi:hypothetical protein
MKNYEEKTTITGFLKENFFRILSLFVVIFNLWLANTLAPISTNLSLLGQRVDAIERAEPISSKQYAEVCARLDRIENKLDAYLLKR